MTRVTFEAPDGARLPGLLERDGVVALAGPGTRALHERGVDPREAARDVRPCAPVMPKKLLHTSGNTSVTIPEIIAHSSAIGYSPGEVVSTGTVSGVAGLRPDAAEMCLRPGDVVECEIERLGTPRTPVVCRQEGHGSPVAPWRDR